MATAAVSSSSTVAAVANRGNGQSLDSRRGRLYRRPGRGSPLLSSVPFCVFLLASAMFGGTLRSGRRLSRVLVAPAAEAFVVRFRGSRPAAGRLSALVGISDRSAASKSRAPVRMPRNSPDDSSKAVDGSGSGGAASQLSWNRLGLWTEIVDTLHNELRLDSPTTIQSIVVPQLLMGTETEAHRPDAGIGSDRNEAPPHNNVAFLAATGSGKTLAYLLPIIQRIKHQEVFENYERQVRRPRVLVLAPTRELVTQISVVLKQLSHTVKVSSQTIVGGQDRGKQKRAMQRPVDIVVATPGRLLKQWKLQQESPVFLGSVDTVVLDEMDTMLEQGFTRELRQLLYPLLYKNGAQRAGKTTKTEDEETELVLKDDAPRLICTSATMTQAVQRLIGHNPKRSALSVSARKNYVNRQDPDKQSSSAVKLVLPKFRIISAPGLHKAVPRLEHVFVDVGNTDKMSLLLDVVSSRNNNNNNNNRGKGNGATIIFCNTAASVRAVQYALGEGRIETLAYHGELNSNARTENLRQFRETANGILVCTDLAARGLDIPQVDHVIMFDFPLNSLDYLHRSGRTARGTSGRGKVTALVAKRDKVLAIAIEHAVTRGDPLDGLSSRKSDYGPGGISGGRIVSRGGSNSKHKQKQSSPRGTGRRGSARGKASTKSSRRGGRR